MPFKSDYFDLVVFYETIEYVENPKECCKYGQFSLFWLIWLICLK